MGAAVKVSGQTISQTGRFNIVRISIKIGGEAAGNQRMDADSDK